MSTQNRYYSNLSQGTFLTNVGGIGSSDSAITVQATASWPAAFPFVVRFEPGTSNEEVGLVQSGSGTAGDPYILSARGYDGTSPRTHSQGTSIIPGFCQLDFAEPQQHINQNTSTSLVSGQLAHGLPASTWGGGTMQLINKYPVNLSGIQVSMPSIPSTYSHLRIEYAVRGNGTSAGVLPSGGSTPGFADVLTMRFNGVASNTYQGLAMNVSQTTGFATNPQINNTWFWCGLAWIQHPASAGMGTGWIDIPNYSGTGVKSVNFSACAADGGADLVHLWGSGVAGGSTNTNPVSSIQINLQNSSTAYLAGNFWLYGIL